VSWGCHDSRAWDADVDGRLSRKPGDGRRRCKAGFSARSPGVSEGSVKLKFVAKSCDEFQGERKASGRDPWIGGGGESKMFSSSTSS